MKNVSYALFSLRRRKLRTILTIFAVSIGTFLIGVMMSLGVGLQNLVIDQIKSIQSLNEITVLPSQSKPQPLSSTQLDLIKNLPQVEKVFGLVSVTGSEIYLNRAFREVKLLGLSRGGYEEIKLLAGTADYQLDPLVTVLINENLLWQFNVNYPEELIGQSLKLKIKAANASEQIRDSRIVGIFSKSPLLDADLVVSDKLVNQLRSGQLNEIQDYTQLRVRVESFTQVNQVADKIRDLGWQVVTLDEILKKLLKYFRLFELALGIFGFVTLAVAALGIINTMVMAIYERTREIGVMRAVGAARKHILKLFLWEASLIGLIGGLIGMLVSWLFTSLLEYGLNKWLISQGLVKTNLDIFSLAWWLFAFGIIFAIAVGFLAGLYPAIRASRLDPIRALRGE